MYKNAHSNMVYICPKLRITHQSINTRMGKQIVLYSYNGILHSTNVDKPDQLKDARHKRIDIVSFHLCKVEKQIITQLRKYLKLYE